MKQLILIFLCTLPLLFSSCSRPTSNSKLKISLGNILGASFRGGAVIYGYSSEIDEGFSFVLNPQTPELDIVNIPHGQWNFNVVAWIGPSHFPGTHRCDYKIDEIIDDSTTELNFVTSEAKCAENVPNLPLAPALNTSSLYPQLYNFSFKSCQYMPFSYPNYNDCTLGFSGAAGSVHSIKVSLLNGSNNPEMILPLNKLGSECISNFAPSSIAIPTGGLNLKSPMPISIEYFTDVTCSTPAATAEILHLRGLENLLPPR